MSALFVIDKMILGVIEHIPVSFYYEGQEFISYFSQVVMLLKAHPGTYIDQARSIADNIVKQTTKYL